MRFLVMCVTLALVAQGCGSKQERIETKPEKASPDEADPAPEEQPTPTPLTDEEQAAAARAQVVAFLDTVRDEKYEQAYEASSYMLKQVYTFDQFLMIAGKLEMEELPCITDDDIASMEQTQGNVGIGPKDIDVEGFLIRYGCPPEVEKNRILFIYLDWGGEWTSPEGVASVWWK